MYSYLIAMRFRFRKSGVYVTLTERISKETVGVYMKNNDYRHFYWGGVMDRKVARFVQARWVKVIMDEFTTDSDPTKNNWQKIGERQVLLGCALPSTYMQFVVFAVIEENQPVIFFEADDNKHRR
jgi:hypothetical protein